MSTATLAGAAIPKAPQELTGKRGGSRKCECFDCGTSGLTSRARIRNPATRLYCACGTALVPSLLTDCEELAPDLLPRHPLHALRMEQERRRTMREHRSQGHVHQCGACSKLTPHPRAECSCGFDNGARAYREGSAYIPDKKDHAVIDLDRLRPETRTERAERLRNDAISAAMPF